MNSQAQSGTASQPEPADHSGQPPAPMTEPGKLDLSRVAPPANLESFELEEITIDGICGVY